MIDDVLTDEPVVIHLHGYWARAGEFLHTPSDIGTPRYQLEAQLARVFQSSHICVLGYAGWDDSIMRTLADMGAKDRGTKIFWAFREADEGRIKENYAPVFKTLGDQPNFRPYRGIDVDSVLPLICRSVTGSDWDRSPRSHPWVNTHEFADWLQRDSREAVFAKKLFDTAGLLQRDLDNAKAQLEHYKKDPWVTLRTTDGLQLRFNSLISVLEKCEKREEEAVPLLEDLKVRLTNAEESFGQFDAKMAAATGPSSHLGTVLGDVASSISRLPVEFERWAAAVEQELKSLVATCTSFDEVISSQSRNSERLEAAIDSAKEELRAGASQVVSTLVTHVSTTRQDLKAIVDSAKLETDANLKSAKEGLEASVAIAQRKFREEFLALRKSIAVICTIAGCFSVVLMVIFRAVGWIK